MDNNKVTVIGLGNSGCKTINRLAMLDNAQWLNLVAFDTDKKAIDSCNCPHKFVVAERWHNGQGCGGNVLKGQRAIARERRQISEVITGSSLVIVTGGLGGGTATGGVPIFASEAANCGIPTIFVLTTPFVFEGMQKSKFADACINELLPTADVVICLPNDLLFSTLPAAVPAVEAFERASNEVAGTLLGIAEMMRCKNLFAADLSDFQNIIKRRKGVCAVGVGIAAEGDALDRCHLAIERMLASPFMGGIKHLENADAVILILAGGDDLQLGEMKKTLESVEKFINPQAEIIVGSKTDLGYNGSIQLTAIAIKFDEQIPLPEVDTLTRTKPHPVAPKPVSHSTPQQGELIQLDLPLQNISKGIFLNTTPVTYNGEDLDIPTYQRQGINIDTGEK
jgi:cell division protein FtsZ